MGITKEKIDLNNLSNKEITKFARKLAETNTQLWNAICMVESLVLDPIFRNFAGKDEHEKFLNKLALAFKKLKKNDDEFVSATLNESYFQDFDYFTSQLRGCGIILSEENSTEMLSKSR